MTTAVSVPARVALAGNPSDGFGGAVVAVPFRAVAATVGSGAGQPPAPGLAALLDAARTVFAAHLPQVSPPALWVRTTIPRSVGLAGSSAVVVAALRVLAAERGVNLDASVVAGLALRAEVDVLGVPAGLQDRVVQAHDRAMFMDFSVRREVSGVPAGSYRRLDVPASVPAFVAWRADTAESSATVHRGLADRSAAGDPVLDRAARELGSLATTAADALERGDWDALGAAMDESLDARARLVALRADHLELATVARQAGAHANYAGSGGSVVGLHHRCGLEPVVAALERIGATVRAVGDCR